MPLFIQHFILLPKRTDHHMKYAFGVHFVTSNLRDGSAQIQLTLAYTVPIQVKFTMAATLN